MQILSFLKEVSSVFEKCQFLVAFISFSKKITFYAKRVSFGQMSEFLSTVVECCANFEAKWHVFLSISILVQKCQFCAKKKKKFGRNVDFYIKCALLLKVIMFLQNLLIFRKMWLHVWRFIYINKDSKSDKNFSFLGFVNLYMC